MLAAAQHFYLGLDQVSAAVNHGQLAFVHDLHGVQLARALVHSTLHDRERPAGGWTTGVVHVNTSSALGAILGARPWHSEHVRSERVADLVNVVDGWCGHVERLQHELDGCGTATPAVGVRWQ